MRVTIEDTGPPTVIDISSVEMLALKNDLISFEAWVVAAVAGKINNTKKRMARAEEDRLKADPAVTTMPASDDGLIQSAVAAPGYMNRAEREAAEAAQRLQAGGPPM